MRLQLCLEKESHVGSRDSMRHEQQAYTVLFAHRRFHVIAIHLSQKLRARGVHWIWVAIVLNALKLARNAELHTVRIKLQTPICRRRAQEARTLLWARVS